MSKAYRPLTMRNGVEGKECCICGDWQPRTKYGKGGYDGLDHRCLDCRKVERDTARRPPMDDTPRQTGYAMLRYEGTEIAFEMDRSQVSLTDLWIAVDRPENKRPVDWLDFQQTKELIAHYISEQKVGEQHLFTAKPGLHGGTWAPREIALAYAMYLNPALHLAVLQFVLDRSEALVSSVQQSELASPSMALIQRLVAPIYQRLGILDLLPGIDHRTRGISEVLAGVEQIRTKQIVRGQIYIIRLVDPHLLALALRLLHDPLQHGEELIAIGRTGPDGNVYDLRLVDYAGKFPVRENDYECLGVVQTDEPQAVETLLLDHPLHGAVRGRLVRGGKSKTFLIANTEGVKAYRQIGSGYFTLAMLRGLFVGGEQLELFS